MKDAALNKADRLDVKDKEVYQLYRVDDEGNPVPTGLPFVVVVSPDGLLTRLSPKEAFELFKEE